MRQLFEIYFRVYVVVSHLFPFKACLRANHCIKRGLAVGIP